MHQSGHHIYQDIEYYQVINGEDLPAVVLIHGYGANMQDLAPLANASPVGKNFNWYFPNGFIDVPIGPHMMGKAWFPVDLTRFETGDYGDLYMHHTPEGMNEAVTKLTPFIKHLEQSSPLILGGFSQGSMMSLELALQQACSPTLLVLLSSSLVNGEKLLERRDHLQCPIFQSHGTDDMVLPLNFAKPLTALLEQAKPQLYYHEFRGGHEIPYSVINELFTTMDSLNA